jgi:hypothetical protein
MIFNGIGHKQLSIFMQWEPPLLLFTNRKQTQKYEKYKTCISIMVYRKSSSARSYIVKSLCILGCESSS